MRKWSPFLVWGARSPIFGRLNMWRTSKRREFLKTAVLTLEMDILTILAKNAHVQAPKNGTSSAPNQKRRPPFHANILPKWWNRHLFHAFFNFGWVLSKFWKIAFFGPFWAVFLWARTQKLAGVVRGQFKSQWLNPNIFEFSEGSVTTISVGHLKILMFRVLVHFLATPTGPGLRVINGASSPNTFAGQTPPLVTKLRRPFSSESLFSPHTKRLAFRMGWAGLGWAGLGCWAVKNTQTYLRG